MRARSEALRPQVEAFADALDALGVEDVAVVTGGQAEDGAIVFALDAELPAEGYAVTVFGAGDKARARIEVAAADRAGAAHAAADLVRRVTIEAGEASWASGTWADAPDVAYRSFLVDMGRNPHSPETLRHVVDMLWFYRANLLQLHLTDDQRISWPSEAYPELYSADSGWTLDDFRALEAYSQARGVTLVPELDVPGHSTLLRARRPDVFGADPLALATSPEAQAGVETLLAEMLEVFQATPYVHIGGDEVFGVPEEVQRDFINRIDAFVKEQGRTTIVWEGPSLGAGDDKVSTDVVHMAWEGAYVPLPELVEAGYTVINASWDPFYVVDHYPRTHVTGVSVDRCYSADLTRLQNVDPRLSSFGEPQRIDDTRSVLGFCMPWWEGREENLLSLCVQRFAAAATRAWDQDTQVPYEEYAAREAALLPRLEALSGFELPALPMADPAEELGNLAFGATVTASTGEHQPHFGPARLTNGITDQNDVFLGYPAKPDPLVIDVELRERAAVSRIRVHETAQGEGWERYRLYVSDDGARFDLVGTTRKGDRGQGSVVEHRFTRRAVRVVRIETDGCEDFVFPSFSRLTEVEVFAE